jgi:Cdc6-like AAA superfamily ATPase
MFGRKAKTEPLRIVAAGDLLPDRTLRAADDDRLNHDVIARGVAEIAVSAQAPVNIALFGPWGSGKSSTFEMIRKHISRLDPRTTVIRYDAWKYGGQDLKRNFVDSVAAELGFPAERIGKSGEVRSRASQFRTALHEPTESTKLALGAWMLRNLGSLAWGLLAAIVLAALWVVLPGVAALVFTDATFGDAARAQLGQAGTVFGLALVALLVGPKVLEGAVVKVTTTPPSGDDQFAQRFKTLIDQIRPKSDRLVVFIDELDRCSPDDVVATLVDLKTFLDHDHCVFIVAADREVIERSLREVPQAKPVREDEPYYATPGAFLDKIFQHQIALPPLRPRALSKYARELVGDQEGIWSELRAATDDVFDTVIFALVPVHVRSPRRVKVLLNGFATNARIAQSRGIPWLNRVREIAVLTVLQTEFPSVAADLMRAPRLLAMLRGEVEPPSSELRRLVNGYRPPDLQAARENVANEAEVDTRARVETAAGELLVDPVEDGRAAQEARSVLNRHLAQYLAKIREGRIEDPKPDLLYLQGAGDLDGLDDPALGAVIDFASDTPPTAVVEAFAGQPSSQKALAVQLLAVEVDNAPGLGRYLVIESACRLVEELEDHDVEAVARHVAPVLLIDRGSPRWSENGIPGAVLVAAMSGQIEAAKELIRRAATLTGTGALLTRMARALTVIEDDDQKEAIRALFGEHYATDPSPLHQALGTLREDEALALWTSVRTRVLGAIASTDERRIVPGRATDTTAADEVRATPTRGSALLGELIAAIRSRGDRDELLPAVFGHIIGLEDLQVLDELVRLAPAVVADIADAGQTDLDVLAALRVRGPAGWESWCSLLSTWTSERETTDRDDERADAATSFLIEVVIPKLPEITTRESLELAIALAQAAAKLGKPGERDDDLESALNGLFAALPWELEDDETNLLVDKRRGAHGLVRYLRELGFVPGVAVLHARDIADGVDRLQLDGPVVQEMCDLIADFDPVAAEQVAEILDGATVDDGDQAALMIVRLKALVRANGTPIPARELLTLEPDALDRTGFGDWLTLCPSVEEVVAMVPRLVARGVPVDRYTAGLGTDDRTAVWIALEDENASGTTLELVGAAGVGAAAVRHVAAKIEKSPRHDDRSVAARRLIRASITSPEVNKPAKREASTLAIALFGRGHAKDPVLAAEIVKWAGGAASGSQGALRSLFTEVFSARKDFAPKYLVDYLRKAGLLPKRTILERVIDTIEG